MFSTNLQHFKITALYKTIFSTFVLLTIHTLTTPVSHNNNMVESEYLRVACWNMRGYLSGIPYLKKLLTNVDILAISEHWLHSNRLGVLSEIVDSHCVFARASKYSSAEFFGSRRGQGGVAIFWRKNIPGFSKVGEIIHDIACLVRYQPKQGDVYFFLSVFLPAQGSDEDLNTVLDEISEIIESREPGSHTFLLGNFNGDIGSWGGPGAIRPPTSRGKSAMQLLNRFGYVATL